MSCTAGARSCRCATALPRGVVQRRWSLSCYHVDDYQQYLAKNPYGYRCHAATGIAFPADA